MNTFEPRFDAAFRLDLEQHRKRAKDLLCAARNDELEAIARLDAAQARRHGIAPRLADAQRTIAHELGLENWAALRQHIFALDSHRAAFAGPPPPTQTAALCTCAAAATTMMVCAPLDSEATFLNSPIPTPLDL